MEIDSKGFRIHFWNARSLPNKIEQFRILLDEHKPQIFCINETWLKHMIPDNLIQADDYKLFRLDRISLNLQGFTKRGGGIAVYIKNCVQFEALTEPPFQGSTEDLEFMTFKIIRKCTKPLYLINLYRPPTGDLENMYTSLSQLLSSLDNIDNATVVIGGDFNIDFAKKCSVGNTYIRRLTKRFSLDSLITEPTRPLYNEAILDQILTNTKFIKASGTIKTNISDHTPIFINIKKSKQTFPKTTFTGRTYRNFNEDDFVNLLRESDLENAVNIEINPDACWDKLYACILSALDKLAPLRTSTFSKSKPEWLTAEIIEIMKDRDKALKIATKSKSPQDKKKARQLRNFANKTIKLAKSEYLLNKLDTHKKDPKKFWHAIQEILPINKTASLKFLTPDGTPMSDEQMSESINEFFANVGTDLANKIPDIDTPLTIDDEGLEENLPMLEALEFEDNDIVKMSKNICIYKSSGLPLISSRIWAILYKNFVPVFTKLYNHIFNTGIYPKDWKTATVVPIPKVTNATNPNDLRPISLLPLPGKILEHLIHKPLLEHLEDNNLLNNCQNGFRPKRSTTQTVFQYTSELFLNLNSHYDTVAVYVDFRKAFDTVSHELLMGKVKGYKISKKYVDILSNYLSNRQQKTIISNSISSLRPVPYGVPQGSVLGPTLFIMYINDVVKVIKKSSCYLYADDMVIFKPLNEQDSMGELQSDVNNIYKWCNRNKLTINTSKTKAQYFPRTSNVNVKEFYNENPITINNINLTYEHHFRYLGIEIDSLLTMKPTYDAIFKNASHKLYLFRLIRGNLTMFAATQILKTMFVSVVDYGNVFLTGINREKLSDLQKLQNDAVRCCLSIKNPRDAHVIDLHEQLQLHLIDHRRTVQLLTCIKKGVENNFLPHTAPEIAILRNQALKTIIPIPRNDTIKKSPYYWGCSIWNRLPQDIRLIEEPLSFKKNIYHMLMNGTLRIDFVI